MLVSSRKYMISIVIDVMPVEMFLKFFELVHIRLFKLPFLCISNVHKILKQIFEALIDLISDIEYVFLHNFNPFEFALLYLVNV
jgi:hypothetical protein